MKTIIHVNQHKIRANTKNKTNEPVLTVKNYKENRYCHEVTIHGESKIVHRRYLAGQEFGLKLKQRLR